MPLLKYHCSLFGGVIRPANTVSALSSRPSRRHPIAHRTRSRPPDGFGSPSMERVMRQRVAIGGSSPFLIWRSWNGPIKKDGPTVELDVYSFTTTAPNALTDSINHERMTVLLSEE